MRRHVFSKLDDLDLDARELAKAAARRAGLSLEEWTATILAAQDERRAAPIPHAARQAGGDLDSIIAGISRSPRPRPSRDYEALMAAAATESERQIRDRHSRDHDARTAIALESMASWIEQTEERLNEAARSSADHQDRMASVLSQALSTLKERLDAVEHRVSSDHGAPARIEFPVQDALKALAPLSETLTGLRKDMSRLTERLEQPNPAWAPAVDGIRADIERLRASMGGLATRKEIAALDHAVRDAAQAIAKDLEQGRSSKDLLTLANSIAALYQQVQMLSGDMAEDLHRRLDGELDLIKSKIDRIAETGVDRSVIDFLSSQIVDMRQDLAHRAEPQQIERLSGDIASLGRQIADLRVNQVDKADFAALKNSLENVCSALSRTVAAQEESNVPEQFRSLSERLDILVNRPAPEPANLKPIAEQLEILTERMAGLSSSRLEQQVTILADRLAQTPGEPLRRALDEAAGHLRNLQKEAAVIAERAARTALTDIRPDLPNAGDLDALKQGFVELKALQSRTDKKTQQALQAIHGTLEALLSRSPGQGSARQAAGTALQGPSHPASDRLAPAERLEAAVRRLHTAALSQIEGVSAAPAGAAPSKRPPAPDSRASAGLEIPQVGAAALPPQEDELGNMRASFIAAARRASQVTALDSAVTAQSRPVEREVRRQSGPGEAAPEAPSSPSSSLVDRIRRAFDSHRRPLLFGLALLILAAGTAQILSGGLSSPSVASVTVGKAPKVVAVAGEGIKAQPPGPAAGMAGFSSSAAHPDIVQTASLATAPVSLVSLARGKFLVDPDTIGEIPTDVPEDLRRAALAGDAASIYEIASRVAEGRGLAQDTALAVRLYERAAQAGLPPAQERLAMLHEKGVGVPRDAKLAAMWYERAAQGGNIRAMHNLATLLASGLGGKPDYAAALRWYGEAAEAGLRDSQFNMGVLLGRGIGARQDLAASFKWFALAALQGDSDAAKKRDEIAARLGADGLAAARAAVEQWRPRAADPVANESAPPLSGQTAILDRTLSGRS